MTLLRRAPDAFRVRVVEPSRRRWRRAIDEYAPSLAERLYGAADAVAFMPFRAETADLPQPVELDGSTVSAVADLQAFTGLSQELVEDLLRRRRHVSFRSEWLATPARMREDRWFYLSSRGYLFANAVHFPDDSFVDRYVAPHVHSGGVILDFGGGTGELTVRCAARGLRVTYVELNALQRDFVRFRVRRHGLNGLVTVLDPWDDIPVGMFDAVIAVDVIEHLSDAAQVVGEKLVPALAPTGVLIEDSPFVISPSNPMHHDDFGLDALLRSCGMSLVGDEERPTRIWRRAPDGA